MRKGLIALLAIVAMAFVPASAEAKCHTKTCKQRVYMKKYAKPYAGWLSSTRQCESGGNYAINTGNGFYGAYQFTITSWNAVGGTGYPHNAPSYEQDYRAVKLLQLQGNGAWPVCGH
jgi:hypothetical protein